MNNGYPTTMAEALIQEREAYVRTGREDRVAQVDAALEALGVGVHVDGDVVEVQLPEEPPTPAHQAMLNALYEERDAYERSGRPDRVAEVDVSIAYYESLNEDVEAIETADVEPGEDGVERTVVKRSRRKR